MLIFVLSKILFSSSSLWARARDFVIFPRDLLPSSYADVLHKSALNCCWCNIQSDHVWPIFSHIFSIDQVCTWHAWSYWACYFLLLEGTSSYLRGAWCFSHLSPFSFLHFHCWIHQASIFSLPFSPILSIIPLLIPRSIAWSLGSFKSFSLGNGLMQDRSFSTLLHFLRSLLMAFISHFSFLKF